MNNIIGKKVKRIDGYEKVTGQAVYGDDIVLNNMVYCANKYTDIACGKIKNIDLSAAKNTEGVYYILTYDDIPFKKQIGPIREDQYVLVNDCVYYSGDVICVVAAKTLETANKAVDLIKVEYEETEGVFDIKKAVQDEVLVHKEYKTNTVLTYPLVKGNVAKDFEKCQEIIEREYQTPFHEHAYIEPEVVVVEKNNQIKGFNIYGSIQNPFTTRKILASFLNLKLNQINVIPSIIGGSFGGKDDIVNVMCCRAVLLCKILNKPIKITNNREASFKESYKRHPYIMNYKVGFNKQTGKISSLQADILADSGAYSSQSFFVTWRSLVQATGPYEIENVKINIKAVYTNNTYTAAFRGFGSPQVIFAIESLIDETAEICNLSPVEIRKINCFKQNSITATSQKLENHKVSLEEVIDKSITKSNYQNKIKDFAVFNEKSERFKKGIGLSCSFRGVSLGAEGIDIGSGFVNVLNDGSIFISSGLTENGQGLKTTLAIIVAEAFGISIDNIVFLDFNSSSIADSGPTVASRGTLVAGNALTDAIKQIKNTLFILLKDLLKTDDVNDLIWRNGEIFSIDDPEIRVSFTEIIKSAHKKGLNTSAIGWYKSPEVSFNEHTGQGNAYFTYVYGCNIAEIVVDSYTGKIDVINITATHDLGKVINLTGAQGQVYGGIAQAIGYSIIENYNIQNGIVKSKNFDEYLLPTVKDMPNIDIIFVENEDSNGIYGGKSLGEPTLELGAAAINNAVSFALKQKFYSIPLTLEKVKLGYELVKKERGSELKERCFIPSSPKKNNERLNNITIKTPKTVFETLDLLNKNNNYKIIAGATDLVVQLRKESEFQNLLNIKNLTELKDIKENKNDIEIGSCVTFSTIINNDSIKKYFPLLVKACSLIGSTQIRNSATIGGNIANAAPCGDSIVPLVLYDAKIKIKSFNNLRIVNLSDFLTGSYKTDIKSNEIIFSIIIPKITERKYYTYYFKLGRRNAMNITRLSLCISIAFNEKHVIDYCSIVSGALFEKVVKHVDSEQILKNSILNTKTISDILLKTEEILNNSIGKRWSSAYKIPVFCNLLKDGLFSIKKEYEDGFNKF